MEAVTGGSRYKGRVWLEIARQIYCENGRDDYRDIGHFASGAPFIYGSDERISISHTEGCLVVATIPVAAESNLGVFSPATALGVDVENRRREKVTGLRERFLSQEELSLIPADSTEANIVAWTCKEAMLKAYMDPAADWHNNIIIRKLPVPVKPQDKDTSSEGYGVLIPSEGGCQIEFTLKSIIYGNYIISIATVPA